MINYPAGYGASDGSLELLCLVLVTLLPALAAVVLDRHKRKLIHLEDKKISGVWVVGYEIYVLGFDILKTKWEDRVHRSDLGFIPAEDEQSALAEAKKVLAELYPGHEVHFTFSFYARTLKTYL